MSEPPRNAFQYAIVRVVPRVERGECLNVGVILLCRPKRFLGARIALDERRLAAFAPDLDSLEEAIPHTLEAMAGAGCTIRDSDILGDGAADFIVEHGDPKAIRRAAEHPHVHRGDVDHVRRELLELG